jgi:peptidoglycan/xylan/chitin deacetylase (PgdA/CDA1 family)
MLRDSLKAIAYKSGALAARHARRNAATLTVLMFHRVLPEGEAARLTADPVYTVTPRLLGECVSFLRKHYAIVGMRDVVRSYQRKASLPPRAALITFDDGWYDNLHHAAPALKHVPWTVFAAAGAISDADCWWQEAVLWALRSGVATYGQLREASGAKSGEPGDDHALLMNFAKLPVDARRRALAPYCESLRAVYSSRMMLSPEDISELSKAGAAIGAHGDLHLPLSLLSDGGIEKDMRDAKAAVAAWSDPETGIAMSIPHGRYDARVCTIARDIGFSAVFSSDAVLNPCKDGWLGDGLLGRIPIAAHDVGNGRGGLDPARLATWLFLRDIRSPAAGC